MHPVAAFMSALGYALSESSFYAAPTRGVQRTWVHHRVSPRRSTVAHAKRQARRRNNIRKHRS